MNDHHLERSEKVEVLVVDDERLNQLSLESALRDFDVSILRAFTGEEALSLLAKHDVALVFLDIMMPGMDGFDVAEYIQENPGMHPVPVIFITAMGNDRGLIHKGYESGAVDYIEKPVDPVILKSKVRFFLENYHQLKRFEARIRDLEQEMANPEQGQ